MAEQVKSDFNVGESVMVNDWGGMGWRPAILIKHRPANHRRFGIMDGWEVNFTSNTKIVGDGYCPSQGGWFSVNCISKI